MSGEAVGQGTHAGPRIGLRTVPHQYCALCGIPVDIGETTLRVFDCLHDPWGSRSDRTYALRFAESSQLSGVPFDEPAEDGVRMMDFPLPRFDFQLLG